MEIWKYHLIDSPFRRGYDIFGDEPQLSHFEFSPLHAAVLGLKNTALEPAIDSASRHLVNQKDAMGRTALSWAVLRGDFPVVSRLLMKGANPNIGDKRGSTPLHQWVNEGSGEVLNALLDAGADIDVKDVRGRTPTMEVLRCRRLDVHVLQKLFAAKPDVNTQGIQGCTPIQAIPGSSKVTCSTMFNDWLVHNEWSINPRTIYDRYPLMSPVGGKDHQLLNHFLDLGVDYTLLDSENRSLLHIAADYGDVICLSILRRAKLKYLPIDIENKAGNAAMDIAVWRRDYNDAWSRWAIREPDVEPQIWFDAFQELYLSIKQAQREARLGGHGLVKDKVGLEDEAQRSLPGTFPPD